jgi:general secretion pathway protein L
VNSNEQGQFSGQVTVNVVENNIAENSDMANNAAAS